MKIKRYTAVSMRAALALVRAEQGPDAVILSSRRGDDGIEVIAAVDYDEALFIDANRQRPAPIIAPSPAPPAAVPVAAIAPPAPVASRTPIAAAPRTAASARAPASMSRPAPAAPPVLAQRAPQRS